jgi:hypothetical protein
MLADLLLRHAGQRLFPSDWKNLIDGSSDELDALANSTLHRGLLVFMNAGGFREERRACFSSNADLMQRSGPGVFVSGEGD